MGFKPATLVSLRVGFCTLWTPTCVLSPYLLTPDFCLLSPAFSFC
jgi:hypothetical protein